MVPSNDSPGALTRAQFRMFTIALVIIILDQVVKRVVVNAMKMGESIDVIGSFVRLTRTANTGAAFGLFRGGTTWFIAISLIAAIVIVVLSRRIVQSRPSERLAFGLILGGALGNLVDRIARGGAVVDFIDIGGPAYRWPAFNVADSAITIGVTLLAVSIVFLRNPVENSDPVDSPDPDADAGDGR
jgi:signal peptidase II